MQVPSRRAAERFTRGLRLLWRHPKFGAVSNSGPVEDSTVQGRPTAWAFWLLVARGHPRRPGRAPAAGDRLPAAPDGPRATSALTRASHPAVTRDARRGRRQAIAHW